jgi:diaminohydroxyphosphoribosylaminopyrimidine deaminase/5-amino-6-(5-phosphoribosylamino)uracil reductase
LHRETGSAVTSDEYYMKRALKLARRGLGRASPNPMVGAVIVKEGRVLGEGYHRRFGGKHAEIEALDAATEDVRGATLYVNLEPCCHYGKKTPPCLDAILKRGFRRVVVGTVDPNPLVNGRSVDVLREKGVEARVGVLANECLRLNESFFKYICTGMPFVTLKWAQTLDGKTAAVGGQSRWISSEPSLKLAHRLRSTHDAVLVGVGTVVADDPRLTVRLVRGRNPVRVVVDSNLRVPLGAGILGDYHSAKTIIATTDQADEARVSAVRDRGVEVLKVAKDASGEVDMSELLRTLGENNISSVLVEGGAAVATSLIKGGLADKLVVIIGPKILGSGQCGVNDLGVADMEGALKLAIEKVFRSGDDLVVEARFSACSHGREPPRCSR